MKQRGLFVAIALGFGAAFALLWLLGALSSAAMGAPGSGDVEVPAAPAAERRVCPSGCTYSSIQAAVDAASSGDIIKVAAGTYTDIHSHPAPPGYPYPWPAPTDVVTQVVYINKSITIRGGYHAPDFAEPPDPEQNPTTLDAQHQGHVIFITGDVNPTIEGLRITGGGLDEHHICQIEPGAGVYVGSTEATVRDNSVFGNWGGGLFAKNSDIVVSGNTFADNDSCDGGGLTVEASIATISGNLISSNSAPSAGGGVWLAESDATLVDNVIVGNDATAGGGVQTYRSDTTLINNAFVDNHVYFGGGALQFSGGSHRLLHNTIAGNTGGDGSGIHVGDISGEGLTSTVALSNTILVDHSVGISVTGTSAATINGILWYDTPVTVWHSPPAVVTVKNQHTGDPLFAPDGYHLTAGSAAVNQGVDAGIEVDIDGDPRPALKGYDLGADELSFRTFLPLLRH